MSEHESGSAAFRLERGARIDKIDIRGNVAGRDVVIGGPSPDAAAAAQDREQLLQLISQLQQQVAALEEAPPGIREDAADDLRKAHAAGADGDAERLTEKLESARGYLERVGQSVPAALALAQTIAGIVARVSGLW